MSKTKDAAPTYTKQQFLAAKRYTHQQKDLLNALLDDKEVYTTEQVGKLMSDFLKKEAK